MKYYYIVHEELKTQRNGKERQKVNINMSIIAQSRISVKVVQKDFKCIESKQNAHKSRGQSFFLLLKITKLILFINF